MNLTDSGNLVLFDDQNSVAWQSFDHPTDCWLLGQKLFIGQKLTSTVVLSNQTNQEGMYSRNQTNQEGMYYLQVTDEGLFAYGKLNTNKNRKYIRFLNGSLSFFIHASEPSYSDAEINIPEASSAQFMKLMSDGHLKVFQWQSDFTGWTVVADLTAGFVDDCSYPLVCGRSAICLTNQQCGCPGREYFRQVDDRQPSLGCSELTPLTCDSTQDHDFITLRNVKYFTSAADMLGVNMETCKQACHKNCSCKAAFFQYYLDVSSGKCFLLSEIFTMKTVDPQDVNYLAFIKVQNVTSHPSSHQVATIVGSTIGSFVLLLVVAIGIITYVVHKRKPDDEMEEEYFDQFPGMPTKFSYQELKTATEDFTKKLGEGGFGSVFEGSLSDGSKIAVKCLEGLSHIKRSFLAEVQSIGSIHHVNLVRLRGFCTWKSKWFLVYDFMSNGSLDKWIYHGVREQILEWKCRKKVILDIAKGLAYLHEDCRQKIIHLDIKPQNILLDDDFTAKVSDFGLSKLIDRNQSQVMTTMRGTPGYLAPEWLSSVITEKVDVYSFGIVLLEILCGRKNFDRSQPEEESWHLLHVFQKCWEQETFLDMVDKNSEDMQNNATEVVEMMKMASWCLQTNYTRRPSMSSVVKVIEGAMDIESNLDYNFTDPRVQNNNSHKKDLTSLLPSILSGPR
ncbi:putative protein kinase RLK-Pelle-SD-2b family [Helianthus debilis subsp. tardiflorus]